MYSLGHVTTSVPLYALQPLGFWVCSLQLLRRTCSLMNNTIKVSKSETEGYLFDRAPLRYVRVILYARWIFHCLTYFEIATLKVKLWQLLWGHARLLHLLISFFFISGKCISASFHPSEQLPNYCHKLQEATASMLTLGSIMVDITLKTRVVKAGVQFFLPKLFPSGQLSVTDRQTELC